MKIKDLESTVNINGKGRVYFNGKFMSALSGGAHRKITKSDFIKATLDCQEQLQWAKNAFDNMTAILEDETNWT